MRNISLSFLLFFPILSFSQGIAVDTMSLTVPQLVRNVLMQNSCSNEMNFKYSSHQGIGQFSNTNDGFPISNGIIIRNGIAKYTEGSYTGINESSQITTSGDVDLQKISDSNGQSATLTDVAYLEFDFTPISSNFSFDFIFASNEYGEYQCGFSDVFAFLLTDITTGITSNLAIIPSTSIPVSVKNIRNTAYNTSCLSINANLFSRYNVSNPTISAINMRGETVLLTATSTVVPNRTYRIKLAIGDYADGKYDSAVFIKGGSFATTVDLGSDRTICEGESTLLDSRLSVPFDFSWSLDGVIISGENNSTLNVTKTGKYALIASLPASGCSISDEIVVSDLAIKSPRNLSTCDSGFASYQYDLTQNNINTLGLNPMDYSIAYFASLIDANANAPKIPIGQLTSYVSSGNQTIYIKIMPFSDGNIICNNLLSFDLLIKTFAATTPPPISVCVGSSGIATIDLTAQNSVILSGQDSSSFNFSYFLSRDDAQNKNNAISNPTLFSETIAESPKTIWVRMEDVSGIACFQLVSFDVIVNPQPPVDVIADVIECSSYVLPVIVNGNYFTDSNGTGSPLYAGDTIITGGTYYIFNKSTGADGCTNESSFSIRFIDELVFPTASCGTYIVPFAPTGNFYTGLGGTGTLLTTGTVLNTNQTIYYYALINGVVCRDEALDITITPLPLVDSLPNVITCDSYVLPNLINGNYFTESGGQGIPLQAGDIVSTSQDIYVYALNGVCRNQTKFRVDIVDTSIYTPVSVCGSFSLPQIPFGNYYDQPLGKGNLIPAGTDITSSQNVYYYTGTTTFPNCTDILNYQITIKPKPPVDNFSKIIACQRYPLEALTYPTENYFTQTKGGGVQLNPGDLITNTQIIYIYAIDPTTGCDNESNFEVEIRLLPTVDSFTDVFARDLFTLPTLTNGTYYTASGGSHGTGTILVDGTAISSSQTIYVYNEWSDLQTCFNETFFKVDIVSIDVGTYPDVNECDSYTLPDLLVGNYYLQPNGQGSIVPEGTILTGSKRIYVYATVGTRLTFFDEDDFMVTISTTPVLIKHTDVGACGSYMLPVLELGNYFSGPNGSGTAYFSGQEISTSQRIYIYATSPTNVNCFDEDDFYLTIYPLNNLIINGGVICVDNDTGELLQSFELVSGLDPAIFTVDWYLNGTLTGTGSNYTAIQEGIYDVSISKNTTDIGNDCGYNPTRALVEKSSKAIATVTVTGAFENSIDIIVNVTGGFGTYEYQLDYGTFQTDVTFHSVTSGKHSITIKDIKGDCGITILDTNVLNYPRYFTPNGDNIHDSWNIWDLSHQADATIYIFDRYGKFIKQFSPADPGWDGSLNGQALPSTDYWFEVFYKDNDIDQTFKSHFSLKR